MFKNIKSYKGFYSLEFVSEFFPGDVNDNDLVVVDAYVFDNYLDEHQRKGALRVDPTELTKDFDNVPVLLNTLIGRGFKKNNRIFCIGGGVLQDLVSFTSSILYRGVDWVFYPTTMLAQCDSCIGSKTSINFNGYKNLLGGFHPPKKVRINTNFLKTLPNDEIKSGIGEMLHYFLLNNKIDISERMVNDENIASNIDEYIKESLSIKKKMIEKDEFDKNERNLFNYGHTFGHAIEAISNYEVNHGQAVVRGMMISNELSFKKGFLGEEKYEKMNDILSKVVPDYAIEDVDVYVDALKRDKKNISDKLTCIMLDEEYGFKQEVTYDEVREVVS